MEDNLIYFNTGDSLFRSNETIYINKAFEQSESHLHAHNFIEIAYVMTGKGIHRVGDIEYSVSKGDLFIINYNIPHEFRSLSDTSEPILGIYNCIFKPEFIDQSFVNCTDFQDITHHFLFSSIFPDDSEDTNSIKLLNNESQEISELYEKMFKEYTLEDYGYIEILRAYVIELLITIFRSYRKNLFLGKKIETQKRKIIDTVISYIKLNYAKEIKLEEISTKVFLSPNYLSKLFKHSTGITISEYIQKTKIQEACILLKETNKTVITLAAEVGYKDIKFFNEVFKKIVGKTPGKYRKDFQ